MNNSSEKLLSFFGLSRASWITLPRVLIQEMPKEWQDKFIDLLAEYNSEFPNQPPLGTRVQVIDNNGKLVKTPEELLNYRYPNREFIASVRI